MRMRKHCWVLSFLLWSLSPESQNNQSLGMRQPLFKFLGIRTLVDVSAIWPGGRDGRFGGPDTDQAPLDPVTDPHTQLSQTRASNPLTPVPSSPTPASSRTSSPAVLREPWRSWCCVQGDPQEDSTAGHLGEHFCTRKAGEARRRGRTSPLEAGTRGQCRRSGGPLEEAPSQFSSGLSAGGPQGCSIFSIKLKRTRALLSFSAMAK